MDTLSTDSKHATPGRTKSSVFRSIISSKSASTPPASKSKRFSRKESQPSLAATQRLDLISSLQLPPDHPAAATPLHESTSYSDRIVIDHSAALPTITNSCTTHKSSKKRLLASPGIGSPKDKTSRRKITPPEKENMEPQNSEMANSPTRSIASLATPELKSRRWFGKGASVATTASATTPNGAQSRLRAGEESVPKSINRNRMPERKDDNAVQGNYEDQDLRPHGPNSRRGSSELNASLEALLDARNISEVQRKHVRSLDPRVKADLVKHGGEHPRHDRGGSSGSISSSDRSASWSSRRGRSNGTRKNEEENGAPPRAGRSQSKRRGYGKTDQSPSKQPRSLSRPRSLMSLKNFSTSSLHSLGFDKQKEAKEPAPLSMPEDFVDYLRQITEPRKAEVGKLHKLRVLTRNESVAWIDVFVTQGGMTALLGLLTKIMGIEWREEHDDLLLQEILFCLKGLCTTEAGLHKLADVESTLFPDFLKMLFDAEKKGPSEYSTRGVAISLMFMHLKAASPDQAADVSRRLLIYLSDAKPAEEQETLTFIKDMRRSRPYQLWCKEMSNVTKEVFWVFLHHGNIITAKPSLEKDVDEGPQESTLNTEDVFQEERDDRPYAQRHFPKQRRPIKAAPHVGGIEWEATNYLATHLDLMNALIATTETQSARNTLREELRASGIEKVMGKTLRTCKEKFYGAVHDALRTWIAAAAEDGWPVRDVQAGPVVEQETFSSPHKSPSKNGSNEEGPPRLQLNLGTGVAL